MKLLIGTRRSTMALSQTNRLCKALDAVGVKALPAPKDTSGDLDQTSKLIRIGGKGGAFVDQLRENLREDRIQAIMHSLKDVPGNEEALKLLFGCYLPREDVTDSLVLRQGLSLDEFENSGKPMRIGTGSLRRIAFLKKLYPQATFHHFRGATDTRVEKLDKGLGQKRPDQSTDEPVDALVLSTAGLARVGLAHRVVRTFSVKEVLPAACQGIVVAECRADDWNTLDALSKVDDITSRLCAEAEREVLWLLNGHCNSAIAAYAQVQGESLILIAAVGRSAEYQVEFKGPKNLPREIGRAVASVLIEQGARKMIDSNRPSEQEDIIVRLS